MVPFAQSQRHVADEITLLCDEHHKKVTNGLLSDQSVLRANDSPNNVSSGVTAPFGLDFEPSTDIQVRLGGDEWRYQGFLAPLVVDNVPLIAFRQQDGELLLSAALFDRCNLPILVVQDNQLLMRSTTWDIEFVGQKLTLREASRKLLIRLRFEPPARVVIERARMLCSGVRVEIDDQKCVLRSASGALEVTNVGCSWQAPVSITVGVCADFGRGMMHYEIDSYADTN